MPRFETACGLRSGECRVSKPTMPTRPGFETALTGLLNPHIITHQTALTGLLNPHIITHETALTGLLNPHNEGASS